MHRPVLAARISRIALAALTATTLLASVASAQVSQTQTDPLARARQQMEAKDAQGAYATLEPLEATRGGDPAYDYLLGIAALDAGHVTRAIFALERVLAVQPGNNLARAEIARAYIASGETDTARGELEAARRGPMPAEAAASIDRVLSALSQPAANERTVRGYVDLGLGWDSNINSATSAGSFAVPAFGGAIFTLAPGSTRQESAFASAGAGVSMRSPINGQLSFVGSANGRFAFNSSNNNFDPAQIDLSAGLAHTNGADTLSGGVQAGQYWIDGHTFRSAYGLSGQWQHNVSQSLQVATFAQWSNLSYGGQNIRDANRYVLGAGVARALDSAGDSVLFGSAYVAKENPEASGVPHLGHKAFGIRAGAEWRMAGLAWFGQASAETRRYGGTEPFFTDTRRDEQLDVALGVKFTPAPQWRITPQVSYTRNHSNIVLYTYDRTVVQVTARREF